MKMRMQASSRIRTQIDAQKSLEGYKATLFKIFKLYDFLILS